MKVALAFWGLTRSLEKTFESIQNKIFNVFTKNNIEYVVFLHTYSLNRKFTNKRTGETNCVINNSEYLLLKPQYSLIDNQEIIEKELNLNKYHKQADPWKTNYNSVDNFIIAMYSKLKLTQLIETSGQGFDYVIFLRPDVRYLNDFNIEWLSLVKDTTMLVPNFHLYSHMNDRFSISTLANALHIGKIFDIMYEYSLKKPLHSETMLYYYVTKILKLTVVYIPILFNRVRANGIEQHDTGIPLSKNRKSQQKPATGSPSLAKSQQKPATGSPSLAKSPQKPATGSPSLAKSPQKPATGSPSLANPKSLQNKIMSSPLKQISGGDNKIVINYVHESGNKLPLSVDETIVLVI